TEPISSISEFRIHAVDRPPNHVTGAGRPTTKPRDGSCVANFQTLTFRNPIAPRLACARDLLPYSVVAFSFAVFRARFHLSRRISRIPRILANRHPSPSLPLTYKPPWA